MAHNADGVVSKRRSEEEKTMNNYPRFIRRAALRPANDNTITPGNDNGPGTSGPAAAARGSVAA